MKLSRQDCGLWMCHFTQGLYKHMYTNSACSIAHEGAALLTECERANNYSTLLPSTTMFCGEKPFEVVQR